MNDVLVVIKDYIDSFAEALDAGLPAAKHMTDAGWDLIALLHERL
jgi:hypothetical protein